MEKVFWMKRGYAFLNISHFLSMSRDAKNDLCIEENLKDKYNLIQIKKIILNSPGKNFIVILDIAL